MAKRTRSAKKKTVSPKATRRRISAQSANVAHVLVIPKRIRKRNGAIVAFDAARISNALAKAFRASSEPHEEQAPELVAKAVVADLQKALAQRPRHIPTVEEVQDLVERQLILHKYAKTAKAYILYREEHAKLRQQGHLKGGLPDEARKAVAESKKYFRNQLAEFVYYSTYATWLPEKNRRETWVETVDRYVDFMRENIGAKLTEAEYAEVRDYILHMRALGSMRLLWSAGRAARKTNVCAYNCSFIAPTQWRDFGEIMYISMCGTGVGFSVEHQNIEKLPMVERQTGEKPEHHVIPDSKEGWADALIYGMRQWSSGKDVVFDYSQVRPTGSRLKTMGGRASGPAPLRALLDFTREKMFARQGRRLSTLDAHDIICKIGEIVVAGGVSRSALISLSDLDDVEMREAKNGQFYLTNPQRAMANNSAVYNEKPTIREFLDEWVNLVKSGSGERGIFNRGSLKKQLPARRWKVFAKGFWKSGSNPCGEIILQSKQFCNLSEVVARPEDTEDTLLEKVRVATILGTYQAGLTNLGYLSREWKQNCEEEALLGVSITGQWDCKAVRNPLVLRKMKEVAIETNRKYAARFGINPSTCITCVKPSGNGSQLFDSSSGMHPRHARFYVRRVRIERHNPLFQLMRDASVPLYPEVGSTAENATTFVLEFPMRSPDKAIVKDDISAYNLLDHWKMLKENYTEHNPSTTISIGEDEWLNVANWVYEHWDIVGGLSFLPRSEHVYRLAPYEEITEEEYAKRKAAFPEIDFAKLMLYEYEDNTEGAKELACVAGACEVDITAQTVGPMDVHHGQHAASS